MFLDINLLYILGPAILIAVIIMGIAKYRINQKAISDLDKAIDHFKNTTIVCGVLLVIMWMSLPFTSSLSTFGYPEEVLAIKEDKKILKLFQEYNRAIVRTTEVLKWFMFLFVWWFLSTLLGVVEVYKKTVKK